MLFNNVLRKIAEKIVAVAVRPRQVVRGELLGCMYQFSTLDVGGLIVHQYVITLPAGIGGTIQITPNNQQTLYDFSAKLESIEFNKNMNVFASNKSLAFKVLAPDFMAWLLDQKHPPQIFLLEKELFVAFIAFQGGRHEEMSVAKQVLQCILRSGALMKKT